MEEPRATMRNSSIFSEECAMFTSLMVNDPVRHCTGHSSSEITLTTEAVCPQGQNRLTNGFLMVESSEKSSKIAQLSGTQY